jgi:hypothetical protein
MVDPGADVDIVISKAAAGILALRRSFSRQAA